ncbi:MAG TPA: protein kinase [Gemmatimonadales bacterium]|jgi:serine/threonine-protein kinase|nr:protein kinase [Gemmatimonadales bacterium]
MDVLAQLKQALSDRYAIEREIGAGGMATVYLARDLRHDRPVALKLLNPELGAVLGVERFLAEIKVTANLQHPNLLPLFDSGEANGHLFYVMPFVEGESLRMRLEREKQLPIEDALRIAVACANALEYAHGQGVIHRDLKPENILLQAGQPVVADFGIALAVSKAGGNRITQTGLSLGTPQYMSPEQATGDRVIDGRSDIYSLAAVAYEMLTGEPPHIGNTAQAIIARLLTDKPRPVRSSRSAVPEHVEAAIDRALEKLPADRFATAREFAEALQGRGATRATMADTVGVPAAPARAWRARLHDPVVLGLAALAVASLGLAAVLLRRPAAGAPLSTVRFLFGGGDSTRVIQNFPWPAAISPDGSMLVYAVARPGVPSMLYLRRSNQIDPQPIPGTENGSQPLFSPDGQWLAFEANSKEKKVRLDGSAPVTIAAGGSNNGADWTSRGELILGSTGENRGLSRVSVAGGELAAITQPDTAKGDTDHLWPIATADGRTIVFVIWSGALATARLAITSLDDPKVLPLGLKGIRPLAVLDGNLVYLQSDGAVMAVPLDAGGRKVTGQPVPVLDPVPVLAGNNGNSDIFLSRGGALVSAAGSHVARLVWQSSDGKTEPIGAEARDFQRPRLSPDGKRIAVLVAEGPRKDIWVHDLTTGTLSRLTNVETVTSVEWTADGKRVVYSAANQEMRGVIWAQSVDVASAPVELARVSGLTPDVVPAPDGRSLLATNLATSGWDVLRISLDSPRTTVPFAFSAANETGPRISPDGHWTALVSAESGRNEVYVRSYPEPTAKIQISTGGGGGPVWSADGARLYYRTGNAIMVARLKTGAAVQVMGRDTAFRQLVTQQAALGAAAFDVARDGSKLVVPADLRNTYELIVVPNWIGEFRQRMAASRR